MQHRLEDHERQSSCWLKVSAWATEGLAVLRERLEARIDEEETAIIRGRIAQLKELLALEKAPASRDRAR